MPDLSVFEVMMLLCFGFAWPVSIWKSWHSRTNGGKSPVFLVIVCVGYVAGILHKVFYQYDAVIWLYVLNGGMVVCDLLLYVRNATLMRRGGPPFHDMGVREGLKEQGTQP